MQENNGCSFIGLDALRWLAITAIEQRCYCA